MSDGYALTEHEGRTVITKHGQIMDLNEIVGVIRAYHDVYFWVVWKNYPAATATTISVEFVLGTIMNKAYPKEVIHYYESVSYWRDNEEQND